MKACMMAIRMLTNAIGNVLDVVVIAALGMVSHKMSIITIFGYKHFKQKFQQPLILIHIWNNIAIFEAILFQKGLMNFE